MNVVFSARAWTQYLQWQDTDRKALRKLNTLIKECQRNPFTGSGKPEPLKAELSGYWSRRIDQEHRLVYRVASYGLEIVQCRYHYDR
ncbi:Txe/YoeB family addiction module toxin [Brevundimonas sp. S30B]|uniref:Txe/YoeB family addiction module toxin n=1 Tax=unclassified Brevundimonas TaxID=2622653 RepID=UPI001072711E|nr:MULTISPECIES: Txe/YoeB family addiction module toxin [unclassified Brevundimonas]QBX37459.1 Txe/YoeB family addiction module toxin [Brevundimonas sp. MF30-B]TFW03748.1 Txe/YoeB family addiction module toxin [Brevundimonas sp. S30B]